MTVRDERGNFQLSAGLSASLGPSLLRHSQQTEESEPFMRMGHGSFTRNKSPFSKGAQGRHAVAEASA